MQSKFNDNNTRNAKKTVKDVRVNMMSFWFVYRMYELRGYPPK